MARYTQVVLWILLMGICHPMNGAATSTVWFQQGVNGYVGTLDTDLNSMEPDRPQGNDVSCQVDRYAPDAQALIRFDGIFGTGPGQVTPDAIIWSATLRLRTSNPGGLCRGFRVRVPWSETGSTWNSHTNGISVEDSELDSAVIFELISAQVGEVVSLDVTSTVQAWATNGFPNYGWGITNTGDDGWQFSSSESSSNSYRPVLEVVFDSRPHTIQIVSHPEGVTTNEGAAVVLSVQVSGSEPIYQWYKDEVPLPEATNSVYGIGRALRTDSGIYRVQVSNDLNSVTSNPAEVFIRPDLTPPKIACAYGTNDPFTLFVQFSENVTNAAEASLYEVVPVEGGNPQLISSAAYFNGGPSGKLVMLRFDDSMPLIGPGAYRVVASAIFDEFGNEIDPTRSVLAALYSRRIFSIPDSPLWKYDDSGVDRGDAWRAFAFDDSGWNTGLPLFGFEPDQLPEPLRTPLKRLNASGSPIRTYYFRALFEHHREEPSPFNDGVVRFRTVLDDAAVIYLNGAEIFRTRLPPGLINFDTEGLNAVTNAVYEGPFTVCVSNLVEGTNVIAAEVHQTGLNSSDMIWGMELDVVLPTIPSDCGMRPVTNQTVNAGQSVTFDGTYECGGLGVEYQWFKDGIAIEGATNPTYTIGFVYPRDAGTYYVRMFHPLLSNYVQSASAQLTVLSCCGPELLAVYGTNRTVVITFDETTTNGLDLSNFQVVAADGSHTLTLASANYSTYANSGRTLQLWIDAATPFQPETSYNLSLQGIEDLFGNRINPMTVPIALFPSPVMSMSANSWRYEISGTDLSDLWYRTEYDDSAWPSGFALFDAKRPPRPAVSGVLVRTQTTLSNSAHTAQIPAQYFRTRFSYTGPATNVLCVRSFIDDGAVFYVNGREALRVRMPAAPFPILYSTLATETVGDAAFEEPYYFEARSLVSGQNLLAVEVHQSNLTSADITFGMELGLLLALPPPKLRVALSESGTEAIFIWAGAGVLEENSDLTNPSGWTPIEGAASGYLSTISGRKFFRLRAP
jgi:hypothetical protein